MKDKILKYKVDAWPHIRIEALTESANPRDYCYRMKVRVKIEGGCESSTTYRQLKLTSPDGKKYKTDCTNTESVLHIMQSIPSPKAKPFKRCLAKIGYYFYGILNKNRLW